MAAARLARLKIEDEIQTITPNPQVPMSETSRYVHC